MHLILKTLSDQCSVNANVGKHPATLKDNTLKDSQIIAGLFLFEISNGWNTVQYVLFKYFKNVFEVFIKLGNKTNLLALNNRR